MTEVIVGSQVRDKMVMLEKQLNTMFIQRTEEIRGLNLAIIAGKNVVLLGPPGTAKSALIRKIAEAYGGRFFSRLINPFTNPDEIWGPVDLASMKQGVYKRVIANKAADAEFVFLDEVFKGSSSILNTLLQLMNERTYDNDGATIQTPLISMIGASNEVPPEEAGLEAFYDRFLLRFWVRPIEDDYSLRQMLTADITKSVVGITLDELTYIQQEVKQMTFTMDALDAMIGLWNKLKWEKNIHPTDRRVRELKDVMAADSWIKGFNTVNPESIGVAAHILWQKVDEQGIVSQLAIASVNPYKASSDEILRNARKVLSDLFKGKATRQDGAEALGTIGYMKEELLEVRGKARGTQREPIDKILADLEEMEKRVLRDAMGVTV